MVVGASKLKLWRWSYDFFFKTIASPVCGQNCMCSHPHPSDVIATAENFAEKKNEKFNELGFLWQNHGICNLNSHLHALVTQQFLKKLHHLCVAAASLLEAETVKLNPGSMLPHCWQPAMRPTCPHASVHLKPSQKRNWVLIKQWNVLRNTSSHFVQALVTLNSGGPLSPATFLVLLAVICL